MPRYKTIEAVFSNLDARSISDSEELNNLFFPTRSYWRSTSHMHQIIVGPPGSGKSMILGKLAVTCSGIDNKEINFVGLPILPLDNLKVTTFLSCGKEELRKIAANIAFLSLCETLSDFLNDKFLQKNAWFQDKKFINSLISKYLPDNARENIRDKINDILTGNIGQILPENEILRRINNLDNLIFEDYGKHLCILIDDFGECDQTAQEGLSIFFQKGIKWCCKTSLRWGTYKVSMVNNPYETPEIGRKVEVVLLDDPQLSDAEAATNMKQIASKRLKAFVEDNPSARNGIETNIEKWFPSDPSINLDYCLRLVESRTDYFLRLCKEMFYFAESHGWLSPPINKEAILFAIESLFNIQKMSLESIDSKYRIPKLIDIIQKSAAREGKSARTVCLDRPLRLLELQCREAIQTGISRGIFLLKGPGMMIDDVKTFNISRLVLESVGVNSVQNGSGGITLNEKKIKNIFRPTTTQSRMMRKISTVRFILATNWAEKSGPVSERTCVKQAINKISEYFQNQGLKINLDELESKFNVGIEWYRIFLKLLKRKNGGELSVPLINITHPTASIFLELGICCARARVIYLLYNPEVIENEEKNYMPKFIIDATGKIITTFAVSNLEIQLRNVINDIRTGRISSFNLLKYREPYSSEALRNIMVLTGRHEAIDELGIKQLREGINTFGDKCRPKIVCQQIVNLGSLDWDDAKRCARHIYDSDIIIIEFGEDESVYSECAFFAGFSIGLGRRRKIILSAPAEKKQIISFWWGPRTYWSSLDELISKLEGKLKND